MADATFDAVIVGGGNKGLLLAMYLIKYGGLSVGIFERRHEIGGCLSTEEISAPGFRGNDHANIILPWYYAPVWRDFPEFWDYGAQWDQHLCADGFVFGNNESAIAIYSDKWDPTGERTAKEIARFSKKDADTWLRLMALEKSDEYQRVQMDTLFLPAEMRLAPGVMERQMAVYPKLVEAGFVPDSAILAASTMRSAREWFVSPELQSCILRFAVSSVNDVSEPGQGMNAMGFAATLPTIGFARGGTHQVAHAAHQVLVQNGCKFFTHAEVKNVIIENGSATGIRLSDGSEIGARKLVVCAGLSPEQLCFDMIGRQYIDEVLARRVELIENTFGCLMWYTFAIHEAPKYKAEAFNPDIHDCQWLGLQPDPDPEHIARECRWVKLGLWPPFEDYAPTVGVHSLVDPSYAPPGKHVAQNEQLGPPAGRHTPKEWIEIKKRYADELIQIWEQYAPNMTWDNVIGVDTNSPYDNLRMKNLAPHGTMAGIDRTTFQIENNRPTPELANHRTPIKNLYATGGCWHVGSNAGSSESYNCYKIIATDMGLGKPWEEPGKEEPDSLIQQLWEVRKRVRASATRKP
ncbi:MAG: NAD(P)/FAD-dependent oxidoreductase [Dehalococcoidia bacterium]|nr:NAD(P)/FAD-dependent oxidoreductase [Dehalococcoidia bacterium]